MSNSCRAVDVYVSNYPWTLKPWKMKVVGSHANYAVYPLKKMYIGIHSVRSWILFLVSFIHLETWNSWATTKKKRVIPKSWNPAMGQWWNSHLMENYFIYLLLIRCYKKKGRMWFSCIQPKHIQQHEGKNWWDFRRWNAHACPPRVSSFNRYGMDSKYFDTMEIFLVSVW